MRKPKDLMDLRLINSRVTSTSKSNQILQNLCVDKADLGSAGFSSGSILAHACAHTQPVELTWTVHRHVCVFPHAEKM